MIKTDTFVVAVFNQSKKKKRGEGRGAYWRGGEGGEVIISRIWFKGGRRIFLLCCP